MREGQEKSGVKKLWEKVEGERNKKWERKLVGRNGERPRVRKWVIVRKWRWEGEPMSYGKIKMSNYYFLILTFVSLFINFENKTKYQRCML